MNECMLQQYAWVFIYTLVNALTLLECCSQIDDVFKVNKHQAGKKRSKLFLR